MPEEPNIKSEIQGMANEPLLPAEKQLIAGSLVLGIILLGVLVWLSWRWFPATPGDP